MKQINLFDSSEDPIVGSKEVDGFEIVYADPPWEYDQHFFNQKRTSTGSVNCHYPTMTIDQIAALKVESIVADNALLYIWTTGPYLAKTFPIIAAWGFEYVTVGFVWDKVKSCPGNYTNSHCEYVLIGRRGSIPQPRGRRDIHQMFYERKTIHSRKPATIRRWIEEMHPTQKKIELFARIAARGWSNWGNELDTNIKL